MESLPDIGKHFTAVEWARGPGQVCRALYDMQLPCMDLSVKEREVRTLIALCNGSSSFNGFLALYIASYHNQGFLHCRSSISVGGLPGTMSMRQGSSPRSNGLQGAWATAQSISGWPLGRHITCQNTRPSAACSKAHHTLWD